MSVESPSSIQKVDSDDSIVACQRDAADFFDSIDPKLPSDRTVFSVVFSGGSVAMAWQAKVHGAGFLLLFSRHITQSP